MPNEIIVEISQPQIVVEMLSNDIFIETGWNTIDIWIVKDDIIVEIVQNEIIIEMPWTQGIQWVIENTFETISKNLKAYPYTINYTGEDISSIVYTTLSGDITKSFGYSLWKLQSISITWITKTFIYTGNNITSVTYS